MLTVECILCAGVCNFMIQEIGYAGFGRVHISCVTGSLLVSIIQILFSSFDESTELKTVEIVDNIHVCVVYI